MQAIQRAMAVLSVFTADEAGLGVSQIARRTELSKATVSRIAAELERLGLLSREPDTKKYRLGVATLELGSLYLHHNPLEHVASSRFEAYSSQFEHNFYLGMLDGASVVYLTVLHGQNPIAVRARVGSRVDAHSTALGKVLLAGLNLSVLRQTYTNVSLSPHTPRTITDLPSLEAELAEVKSQGYALSRSENLPGVDGIGAPVTNDKGTIVASVSVAYPEALVERDRVPAITEMVIALGREVSSGIGGREYRLSAS